MKELARSLLIGCSRLLPVTSLRFLFRLLHQEIDRRGDHWVTAHERPKATGQVCRPAVPPGPTPFAIVIQGPVVTADDFTLGSVELYRRTCPGARLILSTWEGTDAALLERARAAGAEVVTSRPPAVAGVLNVNYQAVSTRAGVEAAAAAGVRAVLKVRSDQRAYAPGLDTALPALLDAFPASGSAARILVGSNDTRVFIPYHLSDQVQCGRPENLLAFWSPPLDERPREVDLTRPVRELVRTRSTPEIYLTTHYLERLGADTPCRLEAWWDALADHFGVIENSLLDWHWPKYQRHAEYRWRQYQDVTMGDLLTFLGWLRLVSRVYPHLRDEEAVLDRGLSSPLNDLLPADAPVPQDKPQLLPGR